MGQYFRHVNYKSFVRQLNVYGFQKVWNRKLTVYRHPHFLKGQHDALAKIERQILHKVCRRSSSLVLFFFNHIVTQLLKYIPPILPPRTALLF